MSRARPRLTLANTVFPLKWADRDFLQVLVHNFALYRLGTGVQLKLHLAEDDDAIWLRQAKPLVRADIADFATRSVAYQQRLDRFLLDGEDAKLHFPLDSTPFPFRYASGGTLPIVRISARAHDPDRAAAAKEYYALFYREVSPVGWNIANGGCDTSEELLLPAGTVERELREELLLIDTKHRTRYVFREDVGKFLDRPEFTTARAFWNQKLHLGARGDDLNNFQVVELPVKWFDGPDELVVSMSHGAPYSTTGCFLNINALDFGIEVDRVAKIYIDEDVALCDGELIGNTLVNAPIGLFEVEAFNARVSQGETQFRPDRFFWSGVLHDGDELDGVIARQWLPSLKDINQDDEFVEYRAKAHAGEQYALCPVTRHIVHRFIQTPPSQVPDLPEGPFRVFISHASEDEAVAAEVFRYLRTHLNGGVFFSPRTMTHSNFGKAIDDALEQTHHMVVIGTALPHLEKSWVEWEWRSFHNMVLSGIKPRDAQLVSYISKAVSPAKMPLPLRERHAVQVDRPGEELERLDPFIRG